jgi:hypothetical protein
MGSYGREQHSLLEGPGFALAQATSDRQLARNVRVALPYCHCADARRRRERRAVGICRRRPQASRELPYKRGAAAAGGAGPGRRGARRRLGQRALRRDSEGARARASAQERPRAAT